MKNDRISPGNWKDTIKEKKVILYNTSIGNMLQGKEKHIEKMKWVFEIFREHPEVVLWWRPHPLEMSTIESMIPGMVQEYTEMRKKYKEENTGILDESADLHRAIAVSDAYYGDWSSVVHLYKATGKPVMFANDDVREYRSEIDFSVCDFVTEENHMWFISNLCNGLFRMDFNTFIVDKIVPIPGERVYEMLMMRFLLKIGRELFLIPNWGSSVAAYDLDTEKIRKVNIGKHTVFSKFSQAYSKGNNLYLVYAGKEKQLKIGIKDFSLTPEYTRISGMQKAERTKAEGKYISADKTVHNKNYVFLDSENAWKITDRQNKQDTINRMSVSETVRQVFDDKALFDVFYGEEPAELSPVYLGEERWAYTLHRYIEAVTGEKGAAEKNSFCRCGEKIYKTCSI